MEDEEILGMCSNWFNGEECDGDIIRASTGQAYCDRCDKIYKIKEEENDQN